jgi:hypothetical protein
MENQESKLVITDYDTHQKRAKEIQSHPNWNKALTEFQSKVKLIEDSREKARKLLQQEWATKSATGEPVSFDIKIDAINRKYDKLGLDLNLYIFSKYGLGNVPIEDWRYRKVWKASLHPNTKKIDALKIQLDQTYSDFSKSLGKDITDAGGPSKLRYDVEGELDRFSDRTKELYKKDRWLRQRIKQLEILRDSEKNPRQVIRRLDMSNPEILSDTENKVSEINKAIARSTVATDKKAKAEILKDGRLEYSIESKTRAGVPYRIKITFRDVLSLLNGEDMRYLFGKYGTTRRNPEAVLNVKEPWQMTREEAIRKGKLAGSNTARSEHLSSKSSNKLEIGYGQLADIHHKEIIKQALRERKPVPPEVLKDYPDLKKNPKSVQPTDDFPKYADESSAEYLKQRLLEGSVSAYSTKYFTDSQNKLLQKWVRQGIVLKQEMPYYSGVGNRYRYYLVPKNPVGKSGHLPCPSCGVPNPVSRAGMQFRCSGCGKPLVSVKVRRAR